MQFARKSEDRSRAVWVLIAVAVRIAKALRLYQDPDQGTGRTETFFVQEMRRRLWLTVGLLDVQACFHQTSEPLIGPDEAKSTWRLPKHINDTDFDTTTMHQIPEREELAETTMALVTYHLQQFGRLMHLSMHQGEVDWEEVQQYAQDFEQKALQLLHFCDPEASSYAWFTWHGTHCLVAGARLMALRPLRGGIASRAPPRKVEGDTSILRLALHVLEKARLMHTDPRGEGFRWYIVIPWQSLAIAIAECYVCADTDLVRRSWPLIEAAYKQHETVIARFSGGILQGPLGRLMRRTREKLVPILQNDRFSGKHQDGGHANGSAKNSDIRGPYPPGLNDSLTQLPPNLTIPAVDPEPMFQTADASQAYSLSEIEGAMLPPLVNQSWMDVGGSASRYTLTPDALQDQSWKVWDEFISEIPFNESSVPGFFFSENNSSQLQE